MRRPNLAIKDFCEVPMPAVNHRRVLLGALAGGVAWFKGRSEPVVSLDVVKMA
jgi:hypothetical protein